MSVPPSRRPARVAAFVYLLFVVYGSLVPLDYNGLAVATAMQRFLEIRYLQLGVESRADWVANILLYIPLAFLLCAALGRHAETLAGKLLRAVPVFLFCATVAVGVEFTQLFFPPRTVSQNDIFAELIGSTLGILVWMRWGDRLAALWSAIDRGGHPAIRALTVCYVLGYLALSFFPYDFLVSSEEFAVKIASDSHGWLTASAACTGIASCAGKLLMETIIVLPLGILLAMELAGLSKFATCLIAAIAGLTLSLTIEVVQFCMASGVSQGLSLVTRTGGLLLGAALQRNLDTRSLKRTQPWVAPLVGIAILPYLLALMAASGWFSARWQGTDHAIQAIEALNWLPFYFHYFTTEQIALRSLLYVTGMYVPIGIGFWLWSLRPQRIPTRSGALAPALTGFFLAFVIESGKAFIPGKHPDPTGLLIAAFAAGFAYVLVARLQRWTTQIEPLPSLVPSVLAKAPHRPRTGPGVSALFTAGLLLAAAALASWNHPLGAAWAMPAMIAYALVISLFPGASVFLVLFLMPVLNLSPLTGWVLISEFDIAAAVTVAIGLLRSHAAPRTKPADLAAIGAISLLATSWLISALVGMDALGAIPFFDSNALISYLGPLNGLRVFKGLGWALALFCLLRSPAKDEANRTQTLYAGAIAGLLMVGVFVLWERATFAGILDFGADYRAAGPFTELHTGGADIHAWLIMTIPLTLAWVAQRPSLTRLLTGLPIAALGSYALAVTYTRGAYLGFTAAMAILLAGLVVAWWRQGGPRLGKILTALLSLGASAALLTPIVTGSYMQARIAAAGADAGTRTGHWNNAIGLMDSSITTIAFGMGLGSFPRSFLAGHPEKASATFSIVEEGRNRFLRLGTGRPLYIEQWVAIRPSTQYTLRLDERSKSADTRLATSLCEKSLLHSFECRNLAAAARPLTAEWQPVEVRFQSGKLGAAEGHLPRPVFLSLSNAHPGAVIEVDNIRLLDESGRDLITNGDFANGGDRWTFASDDHLPWHVFNLWVHLLVETGWFGVIAFSALLALGIKRTAARAFHGDVLASALLAAFGGIMTIGFTESPFDGPRVTTLFFLILLIGLRKPTMQSATNDRKQDAERQRGTP